MKTMAIKAAMKTSISEVMETMFFASIEIDANTAFNETPLATNTGNHYTSTLTYDGASKGTFVFIVSDKALESLTADFLGKDSADITKEEMTGIAKEILNMIAGTVFSTVDESLEFNLGIPAIIDTNAGLAMVKPNTQNDIVLAETLNGFMAVIHLPD